jgi:hypothetical protein
MVKHNLKPTSRIKNRTSFFAFLSLPRELRDPIYTYALQGIPYESQESYLQIMCADSDDNAFASLGCNAKVNFNLVLCNKQIYEESKDLIYELNTFKLKVHNFELLDEVDSWPFWNQVRHLDVEGRFQVRGSLTAMVRMLSGRGGDIKMQRFEVWIKEGIIDEAHELFKSRFHGSVKLMLDRPLRST